MSVTFSAIRDSGQAEIDQQYPEKPKIRRPNPKKLTGADHSRLRRTGCLPIYLGDDIDFVITLRGAERIAGRPVSMADMAHELIRSELMEIAAFGEHRRFRLTNIELNAGLRLGHFLTCDPKRQFATWGNA